MKNPILAIGALTLIALTGCAYHPQPANVYGRSGKAYTAPDLCAALAECLNAEEKGCFYDSETTYNGDGSRSVLGCKEIQGIPHKLSTGS